MTEQTIHYKFTLVDFDTSPWHDTEHQNWKTVDAVLATFISLPQMRGIWENSILYYADDLAVDDDLGEVFKCIVEHTSASSPTTFVTDRTNNPSYWSPWNVSPTHIADTNNPHSVTKTQVGLSNVDNTQQQPLSSTLTSIAALGSDSDKLLYTTGLNTFAETNITSAGRSVIDDADVSTMLTTLGLSNYIKTLMPANDASTALSTLGLSSFIKTLMPAIDQAAALTTLGAQVASTVLTQLAAASGAAGKIMYHNGSVWTAGTLTKTVQLYTSNDTWSKPTGLLWADITVVGGGGGGGGSSGSSTGDGGGGGAGATTIGKFVASTLGATEIVTIGAGGAGGSDAGTSGTDGNVSSFGAHITSPGGGSGNGATTPVAAAPGLGGEGSGGDIQIPGGNGQFGAVTGGSGGDSSMGNGGTGPRTLATPGTDGGGYGSGGGGGTSSATSVQRFGGAGANGITVVVEWSIV